MRLIPLCHAEKEKAVAKMIEKPTAAHALPLQSREERNGQHQDERPPEDVRVSCHRKRGVTLEQGHGENRVGAHPHSGEEHKQIAAQVPAPSPCQTFPEHYRHAEDRESYTYHPSPRGPLQPEEQTEE